ncbi:MAG: hypothetical protein IT376_23185 [Polyangiaceae bacterium]|nr:hypothetical protein [Polyangiaceae bacterium]
MSDRAISLWLGLVLCTAACGGTTFEGPALDGGGASAGQDGGAGTGGSAAGGSGGSGASGGAAGGGGSGASGGGGASGSSGTGGSGGGTCPASPPATGAACDPEGLRCTYPADCWSQNFVCQAGTWWQEPAPGPPQPTCEAFAGNPPADGESCKCLGWLDCTYDLCDTARGRVHAICAGSTWEVDEAPCPELACGVDAGGVAVTCAPGEICVRTFAGPGIHETCAPNPCAPSGLDCWCAASACGGSPYVCSSAADGYVTCDCPVCA